MAPGGRGRAVPDVIWDEHFRAFKAYYEAHGSYPPNKNSTEKLARWVYKQRCRAKKNRLTARRIALLNSLNFDWGVPLQSIKPMRDPAAPRPAVGVSRHYKGPADIHHSDNRPDAKVGTRSSKNRSDFLFKSSIPSYYRELPVACRDSFSFNEPIMEDVFNETIREEHGKAPLPDNTMATPDDATALDLHAERKKQHKNFTSALEKYGSNAGSEEGTLAWHAMAKALKWSVNDVKVYAYSYFKSLTQSNLQAGVSKNSEITDRANDAATGSPSSWTRDELVLLDSLMLKYCMCLEDLKNVHGERDSSGSSYLIRTPSAWENIAAHLPGKTSKECCKMGISRLSVLDVNDNRRNGDFTTESTRTNVLNLREDVLKSKMLPTHYVAAVDDIKDDDLSTVPSRQQRLLVLRHSSKCKAEDGKCSEYAQCAQMQVLWQHMTNCKERNCGVKYCMSSRDILRHYLNCKEDCETCAPLRESATTL